MMGQWFASLFPQMFMQVLQKAFQEKDILFSFPPLVMVTMPFLASFALDFTFKTFLEIEVLEQNNYYGFITYGLNIFLKYFSF